VFDSVFTSLDTTMPILLVDINMLTLFLPKDCIFGLCLILYSL